MEDEGYTQFRLTSDGAEKNAIGSDGFSPYLLWLFEIAGHMASLSS
jgi:hypothetical protein